MAATNETSSPQRNRGWYQEDLVEVNEPIRKLLEDYSKVPYAEVVKHVNGIDLRQLVLDGAPSQRLTGLDVAGPLMNLGYDMFLDQSTLQSRFVVVDVFKGPDQGQVWTEMEAQGGFDVIHCSAFFHLFTLEEQIAAAKQLSRLVKKGGIIVGRQIGSVKPAAVPAIKENSVSYRHDTETFAAMWQQIEEATATRWKVEGTLDMVGINPNSPVEDANSRRLLFTVTRRE
ncbi:hypothetical protein SCUP234_06999 [Seiridium cupressi]